jgi:mono/diheme cytochrome c family protein
MARKLVILIILLALAGAGLFWLLTVPARVSAQALGSYTPNLDNGRVVFLASGCAGCHQTPRQDDSTQLGGGLPMRTMFGTFYPPNISSDARDGLGSWSEADFVTAMWKGTSPDGEHYYPVFPYTSYQRMKLEDVRDLFAYLRTLPAVSGRAAEHDLAAPVRVRRTLGMWKLLFLDGAPFAPDPSASAESNRGAYLAGAMGHCAECHSPRNLLGAIVESQRYAGGPDPEGGEGWVPNITQAGIGEYSQRDIERVLESGETPTGDSVGGAMGRVVGNTSKLPDGERRALAAYIKSLPPVQGPERPKRP